MKLFHGSTVAVEKPLLKKCKNLRDFGKGFYSTTHLEQAKKWAIIKKDRTESVNAIVSVFEFDETLLYSPDYKTLHFEVPTKEWLDFVVSNRRGNKTETFDLIMGPVANDRLFATITLYEQGVLTPGAAIEQLKTHTLFDQLSFHTERVLDKLTFIETIEVK